MAIRRKRKTPAKKQLPPLPAPTAEGFIDIASRAGSVYEVRVLWRNASAMGLLTAEVEDIMRARAQWLKGQA